MTTINDLSSTDTLFSVDLLPVWRTANSDTRKASMATLLAFMQDNIDLGDTTVTASGGTTAITLSVRFSYERFFEDFGAKGDGTTDDTLALQAAFNALTVGGCIKGKPGATYCYTNLTLPNVTDTNIPCGVLAVGGKITFKKIAGGSSEYGVATRRWLSTDTNKAFSSGPWVFSNVVFDANGQADRGFVMKNYNTRFFDCRFQGALVDDFLFTRQNQDGTLGTTGYQSNCGWWRCDFYSNGSSSSFRNQGTAGDDTDANTDGWFVDCTIDGRSVTPTGMLMGNTGGWHIVGGHSYSNTTDNLLIKRLANIGTLTANTFENRIQIQQIGGISAIGMNNCWGGMLVTATDDTSVETLVINDLFCSTTVAATNGQFTLTTTRSQKTVILNNPTFRATTPIVRTTAGLIIVNDGTDGNGAMGRQYWDDGAAAGPVFRGLRISQTPAVSDVTRRDTYEGKDSAGNDTVYAAAEGIILDATNLSEDGEFRVRLAISGTETTALQINPQLVQSIAGGSTVGADVSGEGAVSYTAKRYGASGIGPSFLGYSARGTIGAPASINQFDELSRITAGGYASSAFRDAGYIRHYVFAATPSSSNMEGQWRIESCGASSATITEVARFSPTNGFAMFGANTVVDPDRGVRYPSFTSTALNAIANAVNTTNKATSKTVYNSTAAKLVTAVGSTAGSVWVDGAGTTINTPV